MNKSIAVLLFCAATAVSGAALAAEPQFTIKMAFSGADSTAGGQTGNFLKDLIEKDSNGRIKVEFYPNAQLGVDKDYIEACMAGVIQMPIGATSPLVNYIPELGVFDLPNLFSDVPSAYKVLSGPIKEKFSGYFAKVGLKLEMFVPIGFREMTSSKPVRKFEDFKGIKIRTMDNPNHIAYWKAIGAVPTSLAFSELYVGLQQGVVQAQENPVDVMTKAKLYEQQKYIINTNHIMFIGATYINQKFYDGLPKDLQKVVDDASKKAGEYYMQIATKADAEAVEFSKGKGLEVIDLPDSEINKIKDASKPLADRIRAKVGNDLVNALLDEVAKAKN